MDIQTQEISNPDLEIEGNMEENVSKEEIS